MGKEKPNQAIENIRDKYGEMIFRCSIQHLFESGIENFNEENVEKSKIKIKEEHDKIKLKGGCPLMTGDFQIAIVDCSYELSKISLWDLLYYIKKFLFIGNR
jgi:hypothetical protein